LTELEDLNKLEENNREILSQIRAVANGIEDYITMPKFRKFSKTVTYASKMIRKLRKQSEPAFDPILTVCSQTNTIKGDIDKLQTNLRQNKIILESFIEKSNKTIESIRVQSKNEIETIRKQSKNEIEKIHEQTNVALESIQKIWITKANKQHVILFLAPFYNETRLKDGYFRRIKAIDDIMADDILKVYVTPVNYVLEEEFHQNFPDDLHIDLKLDFQDPEQEKALKLIASMSDLIYYHSVAFVNNITLPLNKVQILDLHGSVPEELVLLGNPEQAAIENGKEKQALEDVDYGIVVSQAMAKYLQEKYPFTKVKYITLPILDNQITKIERHLDPKPYIDGKPSVVYVGGLQKWQMIERMQSLIDSTHHLYNYLILVPSPREFLDYWNGIDIPPVSVSTGGREEVEQVCKKAHFGLLLREDIIVNNVSCPTKLIEYLAYGVVPVLYSSSIGDFTALGMKYITLDDLESNRLPTEEERLEIVRDNYACLERITKLFETGKSDLRDVLFS